jgi:hypothetical protein
MKTPQKRNTTIEPVQCGDCSHLLPEFGRAADVQRLFGIKRGTLYNLLADGKVKGVLLRVRGQKSGVRLIYLDSVRSFIFKEMAEQAGTRNSGKTGKPSKIDATAVCSP